VYTTEQARVWDGKIVTKGTGSPEDTPPKHRGLKAAWKPGQSGNPAGRPKGSRNKFSEQFIGDFYADWLVGGADAIRRTREDRPSDYLKVAVSILPKQVRVEHDLQNLTDEQIRERITAIDRAIAEQLGTVAGTAEPRSGTEPTTKPH
jgi:hypothetical protein